MPTGGRPRDFYQKPWKFNGTNLLIPIPGPDIDRIVAQHCRTDLTQFGSDEMVHLAEKLYCAVGSPDVTLVNGWDVFREMMDKHAD